MTMRKMAATIALGLGVAAPGVAQAAPPDRELRGTGAKQSQWACGSKYVCLWANSHGLGRKVHFNRPGTYKLKRYGVPFLKPGGISSFWNNRGTRVTLIGPNFRLALSNYGNVPRSMNDRATYVRIHR